MPTFFKMLGTNQSSASGQVNLSVPDFWSLQVGGFGHFEIVGEPTLEEREGLIHVNGPAILFPYFRAFVSTLTANTGGAVPAVVIPPHFFRGKLEKAATHE